MYRLALAYSLLLSGFTVAASPDPKDLTVPPAELARARELVTKLGSEVYEEREDAQESLEKMGRLAIPALREGLNANPSPEVRFRCQILIPRATNEDLQARLTTFLADTDGKYEHDLAGWNEFRKLAGGTAASRTTFAELLKDPTNRALVLALAGTPQELGNLVAARKTEIYQWRYPRTANATRRDATVADAIALMFAESHVASKHVPRSVSNSLIYQMPALNTALSDGTAKADVYRAIVGNWIETRDDAVSMYTAMTQATNMGMTKQGSAVAAKLLQMKGGVVTYRMYAAFAIARNGAKEHLAALESVFTDEGALNLGARNVNGFIERTQVQVRDMALVAALLLTGQKTDEYGFTEQYKGQPGMQYTYSNWRLPDDKRKEAFEKWKAWREKNPDFGKEKK